VIYVEKHLGNGNKNIVAFQGRLPDYKETDPIEWSNILRPYYKNFIGFYDTNWAWYTEKECNSVIKTHLKNINVDIAVGLSMGGFAALYYQDIINAKQTVVFSPQSRVNIDLWKSNGNWHSEWAETIDPSIDISVKPYNGNNVKIAFGHFPEDQIHYQHLISLGYSPIKVKSKSHRSVNRFKKDGTLIDFIIESESTNHNT